MRLTFQEIPTAMNEKPSLENIASSWAETAAHIDLVVAQLPCQVTNLNTFTGG